MDNKEIVVRFSAAERYFSLFQGVQTVTRVHPASYALANEGNYARESSSRKCEAGHSPLSRAQMKNEWRYTSTPLYVFMACIQTNLPLICTGYNIKLHSHCLEVPAQRFPLNLSLITNFQNWCTNEM